MKPTSVGNIIIKNFNAFPLYGIVLPKDKFLEYFKKEKGKWPEDKKDSDINLKFGFELPISPEGYVLSEKAFINNDNFIGAKMFGNYYNGLSKREFNFEIFQKHCLAGEYFPQQLPLILNMRNNCIYEYGAPPETTPSPHTELKWLKEYFSGNHKGKSIAEINKSEDLSFKQKNLITILKNCGISESTL